MVQNDPQLQKLARSIVSDMRSLGLNPGRISCIGYNNRLTRTAGRCISKRIADTDYVIEISALLKGKPDALRDVMCHELIHTCPGCNNHGKQFQAAARIMSWKDYDVTTTFSPQRAEEEQIDLPPVRSQPYKYAAVCQSCGKIFKRKRICRLITHPEDYRCQCGGKLKAYKYSEQ